MLAIQCDLEAIALAGSLVMGLMASALVQALTLGARLGC